MLRYSEEGRMKRLIVFAVAILSLTLIGPRTSAQETGIDGKWHFVMDTPGGDREMDANFIVDTDGKVTGKFGDTDVAGTFKNGEMNLDFEMTSQESGETSHLKLDGKLDDTASLSGTWQFSEYNGTFKATRPKS
jgi:hypothetical protein